LEKGDSAPERREVANTAIVIANDSVDALATQTVTMCRYDSDMSLPGRFPREPPPPETYKNTRSGDANLESGLGS